MRFSINERRSCRLKETRYNYTAVFSSVSCRKCLDSISLVNGPFAFLGGKFISIGNPSQRAELASGRAGVVLPMPLPFRSNKVGDVMIGVGHHRRTRKRFRVACVSEQ